MVVVGVDVHKRTHTFVAVDETGRQLGHKTLPATTAGHRAAVRWARERFTHDRRECRDRGDLRWAVEDCRPMSTRLERDLLDAGEAVVRVSTRLMAEQRRIGRARGKSDPIDALAVARASLREPDLPVARHDQTSRELKLLVDRRDDLVAHRTATIARLLWHVHELDPAWTPPKASLDRAKRQRELAARLATRFDGIDVIVAEIARAELADIIDLTAAINQLHRRISDLTTRVAASLLTLPGVGALTAAKIVGETAGISRFTSEAAFARHAGIAPIPVWSGNTAGRVRLTRSGNRQLNAAIHRIAITQIRLDGLGKTYYAKKKAEGKTNPEAIRCLKRRLSRIVYHHLHADTHAVTTTLETAA